MKQTKPFAKRIPRKLKKEFIKTFGKERYNGFLKSPNFIKAHLIGYYDKNKYSVKFHGYKIYYFIDDSFGE